MKVLVSALLFLSVTFAYESNAQTLAEFNGEFPAGAKATYNQPVRMRDGIELSTDVYLPNKVGRFPTLLVRDIYTNGTTASRLKLARFANANGYALVFQSARGRYDSEGHWYPYFQEISDGDDTLTWIAEQAWSDGQVGMFGSSYLASVQWLAALNRNPALVAIAPAMSPGNYYRDVAYPGGAFSLLSRARWGLGLVNGRTTNNFPIDWPGSLDHLPLASLESHLGVSARHFRDWLNHPSYDAYWEPLDLERRATEMAVPALNIGGWYDVFLRSTIGSYQSMTNEAQTERARSGQRLLIGPWVHGWNRSALVGDVDFGKSAIIDDAQLLMEWFDRWMKPDQAAKRDEKPIRLFVMGKNVWRDEDEWPLARTEYHDYFLNADGSLSRERPDAQKASRSYSYDPSDPVPTLGGNIMEPSLRGPYDQSPLDDRTDILRFVTEPFATEVEITGPITAELYAASSAPDTDFMAKLIVVKANGRTFNLVDGVIRARFREGFDKPTLIEPGQVYRYSIDMWATSYVFSPGDRLRVDITSSNFPRLARNLNTGAAFAATSTMEIARQELFMSAERPSHIVLPFIPESTD